MSNKLLELKQQLNLNLHDPKKPWNSLLVKAEELTGIDRLYLTIGGFVVTALWLAFGFAGQLICNSIGVFYPAYLSMHAIESKSKTDDTKWLIYWVVFSIFSVVEYFSDLIVGWFPFYWLIKCIFLIWLMVPNEFNGSLFIYNRFIRPNFLEHQQVIDDTLNKVQETAQHLLEQRIQPE